MTGAVRPSQHAIAAGRRRAFFGLFDADGWSWAIVKASAWFVAIIVLLGYIPDRAYYFTVQRTVDVGVLGWSPVNFCPPENETLPCPAPRGATLPWHPAPAELQLPGGRADGAAAIVGPAYLYAGGSDGESAVATTFLSHAVGTGNLATWSAGPALPEARRDAASVTMGNTLYVIGGYGPDGNPTTTAYSITVGNDGTPGDWRLEEALALPEPRAGAAAVAVSDGIVVMGGTDGKTATRSVWKSQAGVSGALGAFVAQQPLAEANVDGVAVRVNEIIFVIGGRNAAGEPVASVQQGLVGGGPRVTAEDPNLIEVWRVSEQTNLPVARTNMAGFTANGVIYVQGGADAAGPRTETWWTTPDAEGVIAEWNTLSQLDLGEGLEGGAAIASGSNAFIVGGRTGGGVTAGSARTNLAPQEPFFQVGLLGATLPALKLDGEVGQQIGYLNAAGVGTVLFIGLLFVGWGFAHKERVSEIVAKQRRRS